MKILDAPVQLGTLAENMKVENDTQNIWMAKRLDDSSVSRSEICPACALFRLYSNGIFLVSGRGQEKIGEG